MKRRIFLFLLLLAGMMMVLSPPLEAAEEVEEVEEVSDTTSADDWFTTQGNSTRESLRGSEKEKVRERYLMFYEDDSLVYWLDTESIRWIPLPYSAQEDIIDVWIKMDVVPGEGDYSYPQKYYMEHYYLRPQKQQIQFLSELEVAGRPQNAIKERKYDYRNWENLVPGSVEEKVYYAVMTNIKELEKEGVVKKRKSDYDFFDDTLRIGGIF